MSLTCGIIDTMKFVFFILLLSLNALAKEESYQLDPSRQAMISISKELKKVAGSGDKFDAAAALQACDGIATKIEAQKKKTKPQKTNVDDWKKAAKKHLPCASQTSLELIENMADDETLADEPVFNTCVRMVKNIRKTGDCGTLTPTPTQKLANP